MYPPNFKEIHPTTDETFHSYTTNVILIGVAEKRFFQSHKDFINHKKIINFF